MPDSGQALPRTGSCGSAKSLSRVRLFPTPWTAARQAPLSTVILQARILEWAARPSSRGASQPRTEPVSRASCIGRRALHLQRRLESIFLSSPGTLGFPGGSAGKESPCNAGDLGSILGSGRSPGEGNSSPLQYSGLENPMLCMVHGVTTSQTQLSNFHFQGNS